MVVRAYGKQLQRDREHQGLYIVGEPVRYVADVFVTPVVYFLFVHDEVVEIGYGARQQVLAQALFGASAATAFC